MGRTAVRTQKGLGRLGRIGVAFAQAMICVAVAAVVVLTILGAPRAGSELAVQLVGVGIAGAILAIGLEQAFKVGRGGRGAKGKGRGEDSAAPDSVKK